MEPAAAYEKLVEFLNEAKKHTCTANGDGACVLPLWIGSKQLEYRRGPFFYRNIYFGMLFCAGQETVQVEQSPVWSLVYSGGIIKPKSWEDNAKVYAFLRQALAHGNTNSVYRGPNYYEHDGFLYMNDNTGSFDKFSGAERIERHGEIVYELTYSGGILI
ncbi:DUF5680 domain-containing protein [Paenibacillus xylaniclasticus]|uniref:DUF5680 domain-containing protein n=1 Tax=Paenibacillus xylaniclasticus TaxID=588083 RepID=UPI000FDA5E3B|nr:MULTISPECIES: DUF5680 domain-containing protein [Paenibacillus]GFN30871.1 hypothetical protein PCURB6_11310 [Paenibacillus curdlanolyticus]